MVGTAHLHITGRLAVSSRNRRARQHPWLDGLGTLTRPRTHDRGGHPIRDVVADDKFVEHPGNAGHLRTITPRPNTSMHRPSGWSRSYVLASLRALHLDQHLRPGATSTKRALTPAARTGNAGLRLTALGRPGCRRARVRAMSRIASRDERRPLRAPMPGSGERRYGRRVGTGNDSGTPRRVDDASSALAAGAVTPSPTRRHRRFAAGYGSGGSVPSSGWHGRSGVPAGGASTSGEGTDSCVSLWTSRLACDVGRSQVS
jgi:hypothetical protein